MKLKTLFLYYFVFFLQTNLFCFQEKATNKTFDSIYKKVTNYSKKKQNTKALFHSRKLLVEAKKNKNIKQKAKSFYKLAVYNNRLNYSDSAFYYYNKSKDLYLQLEDSIQIGRILLNIAIIESNFGSFSTSDSTAVASIKFINNKRARTTASAYNSLGINANKQFLHQDAISYYKKAIEMYKSEKSKQIYRNNIANVYKEQKNYPKAILILEDLLKDSIKHQITKARIIGNLAYTKWLYNKNYAVLKDLLLAENIKKKENDNYGLIASYIHLSNYYRKINIKTSLNYAIKAFNISKKQKNSKGQLEAIAIIVEMQTPQKAIKYYRESIQLRDSLKAEKKLINIGSRRRDTLSQTIKN